MCWWWRRSRFPAASRLGCALLALRPRRPSWQKQRWPTRSRRWPGVGADRRLLALDGRPGPWLPAGFEVFAQRGRGLDERLAAAWDSAGGPGLQIGMDTPQVTAGLLDDCLQRLARRGRHGRSRPRGRRRLVGAGPAAAGSRGVPRGADEHARHRIGPGAPAARPWPRSGPAAPACATSTTWTTPWPWRTKHRAPASPRRAEGLWRRPDARARHRWRRLHRVGRGRPPHLARPPGASARQPLAECPRRSCRRT